MPSRTDKGPANRYAAGTFQFSGATLPTPPYAADYAALIAGVSNFPLGDRRHLGSIGVYGSGSFPVLVENGGNRLVLEAAGTYNGDPNGARAVVFSHAQLAHAQYDGRAVLFENALRWASKKSDLADILVGITTNFTSHYTTNFDLGYLASRGFRVVPLSVAMLDDPACDLSRLDVLVADWHTSFDNRAVDCINRFTARGGGLVMAVTPRFLVYPRIRPAFVQANGILSPFGLAYRTSLAVPADYGFTNVQTLPYPPYFSAFPAAQLLHQERLGQVRLNSLSRAIALNTINYASSGQPNLLAALAAVYSGTTNSGGAQLLSGQSVNFVDVVSLTGAQATTNRLGAWVTDKTDLVAAGRRGSVEYEFNVPAADVYKLRIEGAQHDPLNGSDTFPLVLALDGESLGRQTLSAPPGTVGAVECWTPYILAGTHRLRIHWDNARSYTALALKAVRVQAGMGADEDGKGIKDWVDQLVRSQCGLDLTNSVISSYTSPVCLEGRDPYPWLSQMLLDSADNQTYSLKARGTTDGRWLRQCAALGLRRCPASVPGNLSKWRSDREPHPAMAAA